MTILGRVLLTASSLTAIFCLLYCASKPKNSRDEAPCHHDASARMVSSVDVAATGVKNRRDRAIVWYVWTVDLVILNVI